jgi:hypothetical protein
MKLLMLSVMASVGIHVFAIAYAKDFLWAKSWIPMLRSIHGG